MLAKDVLTEEWLADVLQDSLDMGWTSTDSARAIMRALEGGLLVLPQSGGQIATVSVPDISSSPDAAGSGGEAREVGVQWRTDLNAAPRDGSRIILMWHDHESLSPHVELGKMGCGGKGWCNTYGHAFGVGEPTHWMPLPDAGSPALTPDSLAGKPIDATQTREAELRTGILRAALCLSGCAGEGITIDGFDDPADVFCDLVKLLGLPDADDDALRAALSARGGV